jgi:hypothetical protein
MTQVKVTLKVSLQLHSCKRARYCKEKDFSRTSNNGHCRGIPILSVIGGVRYLEVRHVTNFTIVLVTIRSG